MSSILDQLVEGRLKQTDLFKALAGKVKVQREVTRSGKTFVQTFWVNPEDVPQEEKSQKSDRMQELYSKMHDEDNGVRMKVADRIDQAGLHEMMNDENAMVRHGVVNRIDQVGLHEMMGDEDGNIREHVAKRIDQAGLREMMNDENVCSRGSC